MKKRILSILLMLCMVLSALPLTVFAEETQKEIHYGVWIEGKEITSSRLSERTGWSFDPETYTLYLRNYQNGTLGYEWFTNTNKRNGYVLIYTEQWIARRELTIHVSGENNYLGDETFPYTATAKNIYYGIFVRGKLTITGDPGSKLKIFTNGNAIVATNDLTVKNNVTIEATSLDTTVYTTNNLTMEGYSRLYATCTGVYKGLAAVSVNGDLHSLTGSYLEANAIFRVPYHELSVFWCINKHNNVISSVYVYGGAYINGGKVLTCFEKKESAYVTWLNGQDFKTYSEERYGTSKAFFAYCIYIDNGGELSVFFDRPEDKSAENELAVYCQDEATIFDKDGETPSSIHFYGDGVFRAAMNYIDEDAEEWECAAKSRITSVNSTLGVTRRGFAKPPEYSHYQDYYENRAYKHDGIYLYTGTTKRPTWSYFEDRLFENDMLDSNRTLELRGIVKYKPQLVLTAEPGTYTVDPAVNKHTYIESQNFEIPEMVVKKGATLKLKLSKSEVFVNPITLKGGTLEIAAYNLTVQGLDIRGYGTVIFNGGTVSGNVEKSVKMVINSGNIDVPDNGNAVDENGKAIHKYTYQAYAEDKFSKPLQVKLITGNDNFTHYNLNAPNFHTGVNGEKLLYLWLDRSDRPLLLYAQDPTKTHGPIRYERSEYEATLYLRFGTNTFAEQTHLSMRSNEVVAVREGRSVSLYALDGKNVPTDLQNIYVSSVKWYESSDGGQTFRMVSESYGGEGGVNYSYTIPQATGEQNGYIYRAEVTYLDSDFSEPLSTKTVTQTYEATLFVEQYQLTAPDRFAAGAKARFEVTSPAPPEGVTVSYQWQTSLNGSEWTDIEGETGSVYEPVITDAMDRRQIQVIILTKLQDNTILRTTRGPVSISINAYLPIITGHPQDITRREFEEENPGDGSVNIFVPPTLKVTATGENLSYQWQLSTDGGGNYTDIANATAASYRLLSLPSDEQDGWLYRCIVSNEFGAVPSEPSRISVIYPPKFVINPSDNAATEGQTATFYVHFKQGVPFGTDVYWQISTDGGQTFRNVTEEDGSGQLLVISVPQENGERKLYWTHSFTTCTVTKDMEGYQYRCVVKTSTPNDAGYNGIRYSSSATLTVKRNCLADGHLFDDGTVKSEPTCTDSGFVEYVCSACDHTETRYTDPLKHDWAEATCQTSKTCKREGCGATEGSIDRDNHTGETEWISTATQHTQRYKCCGLVTVKTEAHAWDNSVCTKCGYHCTDHDGGTASCTEKAVCEICGSEYGGLGDHDYKTEWSSDNTEHWHDCKYCDSRSGTEAHSDTDSDHICDVCGQTISDHVDANNDHICEYCGRTASDHTGGTASCIERAVCDICGSEYGGLGDHDYKTEWSSDNTEHWHDCKYCDSRSGTEAHSDTDSDHICDVCGRTVSDHTDIDNNHFCDYCGRTVSDHTGGTATCIERAVCGYCGQPYGSLKEHTYKSEWSADKSEHWHECAVCETKKDKAAHTYRWESQDGQYWQRCEVCGIETEKKEIPEIVISGAERVCRTQDYRFSFTLPEGYTLISVGYAFELLGGELTAVPEDGIYTASLAASDYPADANSFKLTLNAVTSDGLPIRSERTVTIQNDHSGGKASCKNKAVCKICGEEYGNLAPHELTHIAAKSATAAETGNTEYWHCDICDQYFSDENTTDKITPSDTVIPKLAPTIIAGGGASVTEGEDKELSFTSDAASEDLIRVEVDGKTVDESNYTVGADGTVTLNPDYVAALSGGEHTLGIVSESGTATATFTVNKKAAETTTTNKTDTKDNKTSPQTGDSSNLALWIALLFISGGAVIGTTVVSKKKRYNK